MQQIKGKLHSKIISSDMKGFFRRIQWWRSEVEIRTGRWSNRRPKMAEKFRVTTPRGRHESLVPGVSSSRLRPDSDQSRIWCRARPWLVCDSLNELTWVSFVVHWHLTAIFFFFFFLSFRECCLTRQWQSTECDTRYMVQRKKFDVILRFLVDRYRRTKPPKPEPDASQFVVPARLPKPVQQLAPNFRQRDCEAARGPREGRERAAGGPREGRGRAAEGPREGRGRASARCPNFIREILRLKKTTSRCGRCSTPCHNLTVFAWRCGSARTCQCDAPFVWPLFFILPCGFVVEGSRRSEWRTTCEPGRTSPYHVDIRFACSGSGTPSRKPFAKSLVTFVFLPTQFRTLFYETTGSLSPWKPVKSSSFSHR